MPMPRCRYILSHATLEREAGAVRRGPHHAQLTTAPAAPPQTASTARCGARNRPNGQRGVERPAARVVAEGKPRSPRAPRARRDRDRQPAEPRAHHGGELHVAEADAVAAAHAAIEHAQRERQQRQRRAAQQRHADRRRIAVLCQHRRVDQRERKPRGGQLVGMMNQRASIAAIASMIRARPAPSQPGTPGAAQMLNPEGPCRTHDARPATSRTDGPLTGARCWEIGIRREVRSHARGVRVRGQRRAGPRSLVRISSATRIASTPSRMICGRMKMISSVRWFTLSLVPSSLPMLELVDDRKAGAAVLLSLADQAGEQHGLSAGDRDRERTRRCDTVGVRLPAVPAATLEISCSTSSSTLPLALMRGTTRRITPVLR